MILERMILLDVESYTINSQALYKVPVAVPYMQGGTRIHNGIAREHVQQLHFYYNIVSTSVVYES